MGGGGILNVSGGCRRREVVIRLLSRPHQSASMSLQATIPEFFEDFTGAKEEAGGERRLVEKA